MVDTLILKEEEFPDREYEEMTGGSITFDFSSAESKFIKSLITAADEYVISVESENYLGEGGVTFTIDGVDYGYTYDGQKWTVAEGGLVFDGDLWEGAEVKIEVFCLDAALRASLGEVTVRIETKAQYELRKEEENTPPVFGQEWSGVYYGACGGNIIVIAVEEQGITYNGNLLTFIKKKNGRLNYRSDEGNITFVLEQVGTLSVTDQTESAEYTAYKKVDWQGFDEDRQGNYSFFGDIELSGKMVNLSITLTLYDKIFEYSFVLSDGDKKIFRLVLIGIEQGVYTFMNGYGEKITFGFNDKDIVVLSDGIQPFVGTYTAVKEGEIQDEPKYLAIDENNIIDQSGEYTLILGQECTLVITFDENKMTVYIDTVVKHSGDLVDVTAESPLVFNIVLTDGVVNAVFRAAFAVLDSGGSVNSVGDYGELSVGDNAVVFENDDIVTLYLSIGESISEGVYKLTFVNVAEVMVNGEWIPIDLQSFTVEVTVSLVAGGEDYAEIVLSYRDVGFPVKVIVEKLS